MCAYRAGPRVQYVKCPVAWGSGLFSGRGFRWNARAGWLGSRSADGVMAACDHELLGFGWSEPHFELPMLLAPPMLPYENRP